LSYVVGVYRGEVIAQRSPTKLALFVAVFPQRIAGPIVRYKALAPPLDSRRVDIEGFAEGARRKTFQHWAREEGSHSQ
jgi:alginate O-acetyltransferase complex protein AlgI